MFTALSDLWRLLRAGAVLVCHDVILPKTFRSKLPLPARIAGIMMRILGGGVRVRPGKRLAIALTKLGPVYVKLGQFLATRPDVLGVEATQDLSKLKDDMAPFSTAKAKMVLKNEFEEEYEDLFGIGISEPVAAASLAQVHKLELEDGIKAVKILRPGVDEKIARTLRSMSRAASNIERISQESRRLRPVAFTDTIAASMNKELDLRFEAGGMDALRSVPNINAFFEIPSVDWQRTSRRVLTMDWIEGIPLTSADALTSSDINRVKLANKVTQGFLTQAVGHGVFHADMHEGNLLLTKEGKLGLIDFGIVGRIGMSETKFLAETLWGFINRDYDRIARVHFESGYVPKNQSEGDFAQALRSVGEPVYGKAANEVSMGKILIQLFDYTHQFGMQLRPELVLLQKTMVQVEGVARLIDPNHDIWAAAEPIVSRWIKKNLGPEGIAKQGAESLRELAGRFHKLPVIVDSLESFLEESKSDKREPEKRAVPWWGWFGFIFLMFTVTWLAVLTWLALR